MSLSGIPQALRNNPEQLKAKFTENGEVCSAEFKSGQISFFYVRHEDDIAIFSTEIDGYIITYKTWQNSPFEITHNFQITFFHENISDGRYKFDKGEAYRWKKYAEEILDTIRALNQSALFYFISEIIR